MNEVTRILSAIDSGEPHAAEELLPVVYTELRRLAARHMAHERPGQTIQATALVHEAWLRLVREEDRSYNSPRHFFCAAATAMRRILIDIARRKHTRKHGGHLQRVNFDDISPAQRLPSDDLLAVDAALEELAAHDPDAAKLVELRYFVGLGHQDAARMMDLSRRQADRLWAYARAWLFDAIRQDLGADGLPGSP